MAGPADSPGNAGFGHNHRIGYVETAMTVSAAPVTMYTTPWCGYCVRLKKALSTQGIAYTEVDIENDAAAADFVMSVNSGNATVPTLKFPDGSTLTNPSIRDVADKLAG